MKIDDVTPAKAGFQSKKAGFPLEFIPHTMRGGNPGAPGLFPQQILSKPCQRISQNTHRLSILIASEGI